MHRSKLHPYSINSSAREQRRRDFRDNGSLNLSEQSHPENFRITRLDLLALRFHRGRIALHSLDRGERRPSRLVFHLGVEGAVSEIDEDLLTLEAE
jgi:hypothetical protein